MKKTTYVGIIKVADGDDIQTLVNAVDETDAMEQVLEKFKTSFNYTKDDVIIRPFFETNQ